MTVRAALSIDDYRRQVIAFAENFRDFYAAAGPRQLGTGSRSFTTSSGRNSTVVSCGRPRHDRPGRGAVRSGSN